MKELSILVISDIHAFDGDPLDDKSVSHFSTRPSADPAINPFVSIPDLLARHSLKVDWILTPGDLADRADPAAQNAAWTALQNLKTKVGAYRLIGTIGNHDIDSRLAFDQFDTKSALQCLVPPFPGLEEHECDFFWSRNFFALEQDDALLLVLNSSAFHGTNSDTSVAKEYEHGRVSGRTISAIQKKLKGRQKPLQVLLTHHHIYRNDRIFTKDYSEMKNGSSLLEMLSTQVGGQWIVIHGHQHYPTIHYGHGDSESAIIFSAGSFSRRLNELSRESANQFYHISFPVHRYAELGWHGCGTCHAWDWTPGSGWEEARGIARIPHRSGFGCRSSADKLASEIATLVGKTTAAINWEELPKEIPSLAFVLPSEIKRALTKLESLGIHTYGSPFSGKCQLSRA